jgi:alpha-D-xyloside xylohydrolase
LTYHEASRTLTIGERKGSFAGMPEERTFQIVWIKTDQPAGVSFSVHPDEVIRYTGKEISLKMN